MASEQDLEWGHDVETQGPQDSPLAAYGLREGLRGLKRGPKGRLKRVQQKLKR